MSVEAQGDVIVLVGNVGFLQECLANKVCAYQNTLLLYKHVYLDCLLTKDNLQWIPVFVCISSRPIYVVFL